MWMLAVLLLPDENCEVHCIGMLESLVLCELRVCCGISKVGEAIFDILVIGYSTGTKAFNQYQGTVAVGSRRGIGGCLLGMGEGLVLQVDV